MSDLLKELSTITEALEEAGIEYAVCGGLALSILGFSRATFDIDILIQADSLDRSYEIAENLGFDIRGLDMSFKERAVEIRRVSKIDDDGEVMSLDLLLVTPQVEDVWKSRRTVEWEGNPLSIVSKEGLIRLKELSGRHKDLIDIDWLKNDEN